LRCQENNDEDDANQILAQTNDCCLLLLLQVVRVQGTEKRETNTKDGRKVDGAVAASE
jgi:hypothetical protein